MASIELLELKQLPGDWKENVACHDPSLSFTALNAKCLNSPSSLAMKCGNESASR